MSNETIAEDFPDEGTKPPIWMKAPTPGREDAYQAHWLSIWLKCSVRYDPIVDRWHVLDPETGLWTPDDGDMGQTRLRVQTATLERLGTIFATIKSEKSRDFHAGITRKLLNVADQTRALKALAILPDYRGSDWDPDPYLIGVADGVVDIASPEKHGGPLYVRPGEPGEHVTRRTTVPFDNAATCPMMDAFLLQICSGDQSLVDWLWRWYGMALLGDTREQKFLVETGDSGLAEGRNGKGTLNEVMTHVFGTYAGSPDAALYMKTRHGVDKASVARPDLLKLRGLRLAVMSEPPGGEFNQELLKAHTGSDTIEARDLYGGSASFAEWTPTHTIVFLTNRPPKVEDIGPAIEDRLRVVKFLEHFATKKEGRDLRMAEKLKAEAPGILARLIREARAWYELTRTEDEGLPTCQRVNDASREYIASNWPLAVFVEERCVLGENERGSAKALYDEYTDWATVNDIPPNDRLTQTAFGLALGKRYRKLHDKPTRYVGIRPLGTLDRAARADDRAGMVLVDGRLWVRVGLVVTGDDDHDLT